MDISSLNDAFSVIKPSNMPVRSVGGITGYKERVRGASKYRGRGSLADAMRIWSLHPRYLDWKGLGALWRETLLAQKVLQGETRGWRNHPQLDRFKTHRAPLHAVGYYLVRVFDESRRRGYSYNYSKILYPEEEVDLIGLNHGQLEYEFNTLQKRLMKRQPDKYRDNLVVSELTPHPLFKVRPGSPEPWEKSYWVKKIE